MSSGHIATLHSRHFLNTFKWFMIILLDTSKRFEASFVKERLEASFVSPSIAHRRGQGERLRDLVFLSLSLETDDERQQIHSSSPNRMFRKMRSL